MTLTWHSPPGVKPAKGYFITIVDSIYQNQRECLAYCV